MPQVQWQNNGFLGAFLWSKLKIIVKIDTLGESVHSDPLTESFVKHFLALFLLFFSTVDKEGTQEDSHEKIPRDDRCVGKMNNEKQHRGWWGLGWTWTASPSPSPSPSLSPSASPSPSLSIPLPFSSSSPSSRFGRAGTGQHHLLCETSVRVTCLSRASIQLTITITITNTNTYNPKYKYRQNKYKCRQSQIQVEICYSGHWQGQCSMEEILRDLMKAALFNLTLIKFTTFWTFPQMLSLKV